jgi:glycosyltransferase involved in cell wall biosynthesis
VEREAASLRRAGYEVTVLAWDRTGKLPRRERREGYVLIRLPIPSSYAKGLRNFPGLLRWQIALTAWLIRHRKSFDLIHACDFDTVLPALICKWLFAKKVIYDIFDFYADHLRATPEWVKRLIRVVDLWAVRRAEGVIVVDECRLSQLSGAQPQRLSIIYNSPRDVAQEIQRDISLRQDPLRIIYVGLLQVERGLIELLGVLKKHPGWRLDLAGFGGDEKEILTKAEKIPGVYWHGRIPYQEALRLSAASDVIVATYDPGIPNHRFASPNKIFEAMMLSKPLIVARGTNMDRIVEHWGCGLVVTYGDEGELEEALCKLEDNSTLRKEFGERARTAYESKFAWSKMESRLYDIYHNVLHERYSEEDGKSGNHPRS